MERIEKSIDVDLPCSTVYNQWTQFEEFPRFMDGVEEVQQVDDAHLHWRASVGGKRKEWDAEIVEQVPDRRIAWRSTSGARNAGAVEFEAIDPRRTRVRLILEYEPEGFTETVGDAIGVMSRSVQSTLDEFKQYVESRGRETGAWRGEVRDGRATGGETAMGQPQGAESRGAALGRVPRGRVRRYGTFEEPFEVIRRMMEDMDRAFSAFGMPSFSRPSRWSADEDLWMPHVDVEQRKDELVVTADLPGIRPDDLRLEINDGALVLQGERRADRQTEEGGAVRTEREYGTFHRTIPLPDNVDADSVRASLENGVLRISLRAPQAPRGRQVPIEGR